MVIHFLGFGTPGYDCTERKGHSSYQGREEHPGGGEASLHCRLNLRLSDGRKAIPHPGVLEWLVQAVHTDRGDTSGTSTHCAKSLTHACEVTVGVPVTFD